MIIKLKSKVKGNYKDVYKSFDQDLFEFLLPPGAQVIRFDGSETGNVVHLKFSFPLNAEWISEIVEDIQTEDYCYFVDVGVKVPFGIKTWRHKHIVRKEGSNSIIEDDIEFSTGNTFLDRLYYPGLYIAFLPRVNQYKKYFNQKQS